VDWVRGVWYMARPKVPCGCSPGVHGRRILVGEVGVRELWKRKGRKIQKIFEKAVLRFALESLAEAGG
jgi:hypothetical protein